MSSSDGDALRQRKAKQWNKISFWGRVECQFLGFIFSRRESKVGASTLNARVYLLIMIGIARSFGLVWFGCIITFVA